MKILYVDIDTLRPDHLGCYGYGRNTSPNFDAIAKEGVVFDNYYCSDAPCLPSRAALISGMFGIHNGAVGHGGTAADRRLSGPERDFSDELDRNNFISVFRRAGMYTASISTFAERHSSWWFNAGFNETHNVGGRGMESGEDVLPVALDWIRRNAERENWFLHLHLWDPHTPYRAPAWFGNPFKNEPLGTWITEDVFREHLGHIGPHGLREISMFHDREDPRYPNHPGKVTTYPELRRIIDGYDCGVRYADLLVGQVFDALRTQGVFDDAAVIISSDHGENLGELGIYSEHATADQPTCRIPMIIRWPGGMKNHRDKELHCNIDLVPTAAELLGVEKYPKWDGASYADTLRAGAKQGRDSLVISQMAHVCQRSARFENWLYIRTLHDGLHLLDREMLFDLAADPYEQHNLAEKHPGVCARGAKIILDWHDEMMLSSESPVDPMWTVMHEGGPYQCRGALPGFLERLEQTSRAEGAAELRRRHPRGF